MNTIFNQRFSVPAVFAILALVLVAFTFWWPAWFLGICSISVFGYSLFLFISPPLKRRAALREVGLTSKGLQEFNVSFSKIAKRVFGHRAELIFYLHPTILEWAIVSIIDGKECMFIYNSAQVKAFIENPVSGLNDFFNRHGIQGNYFELAWSPIRNMAEELEQSGVNWFYLDSDRSNIPAGDCCARCRRPFTITQHIERIVPIVLHESKPFFRIKTDKEVVPSNLLAAIGSNCLKEVKMEWGSF